jgi:hypothetical protein
MGLGSGETGNKAGSSAVVSRAMVFPQRAQTAGKQRKAGAGDGGPSSASYFKEWTPVARSVLRGKAVDGGQG